MVLVPIAIEGQTGVLEMTVLDGHIPRLLSVGFLEFLKARFDLESNKMELQALGVELGKKKFPTGHRTILLNSWNWGHFPVPESVLQKYGVTGAFNVSGVSCVYKACSGPTD